MDLAQERISSRRDRLIGIYIGILAALLAVCSLGGGNATKTATLLTIQATDMWAFFQAKNIRRQVVRVAADELDLLLAREPSLTGSAKAAVEAKLKAYREQERRLTSEPDKGEGIEELLKRGKELEAMRDKALKQDPYFDYAQVFLQIAIVLASVAIIAGGTALLYGSAVLGLCGSFLMFNGFTLVVSIPFIG